MRGGGGGVLSLTDAQTRERKRKLKEGKINERETTEEDATEE